MEADGMDACVNEAGMYEKVCRVLLSVCAC